MASSIGALKGPLHGGANEEVVMMLREIGTLDKARPYVERALQNKNKLMGFGHRVYKVKDPRATVLQELCRRLFKECGSSPLYEIAVEVEATAGGALKGRASIPMSISTPVLFTTRWASMSICLRRCLPWRGCRAGWPIGWSSCAKINSSGRARSTPASITDPMCLSINGNPCICQDLTKPLTFLSLDLSKA